MVDVMREIEKQALKRAKMKKPVVLEKPSGTIEIRSGNLNLRERKTYNVLLYFAKEKLRKDANADCFTVNLPVLKHLIGAENQKKNIEFMQILDKLAEDRVEYNILGKDKIIRGKFTSLPWVEIEIDKKTGAVKIKYDIPKPVKFAILNAGRDKDILFGRIDIIVEKDMNSKYATILYELIKDYEKVNIPLMTIKDFRKLFGIENKYRLMQDLKKRVLNPAIKEINENPLLDFVVDYELYRTGRAYTHIKFIIKPKPTPIKADQKLDKIAVEYAQEIAKESPELKKLLALIPKDLRKKRRIVGIVMSSLEKKGFEYTKAQIEYVLEKYENKKIRNFEGYLKQAIEKDYAGAETIELGELEVLTYKDLVGVRFTNSKTGKVYEITKIEKDTTTKVDYLPEDKKEYYLVFFKNLDDENDTLVLRWDEKEVERKLERLKEIKRKKQREGR